MFLDMCLNFTAVIAGPSKVHDANHGEGQSTPVVNKRTYSQMMARAKLSEEKFQSVLSPIGENSVTVESKRMRMECRGARRLLFNTGDESTPSSSRNYDSSESDASESTSASDKNTNILSSPTVNLPNFVIDGTAPHLLQMSPQKQKENVDWLTKMRKERYEQLGKFTVGKCSPKSQAAPARRTLRTRSHDSQKISKTTKNSAVFSLVDFFKALNTNCEKNSSIAEDVPSTSDRS